MKKSYKGTVMALAAIMALLPLADTDMAKAAQGLSLNRKKCVLYADGTKKYSMCQLSFRKKAKVSGKVTYRSSNPKVAQVSVKGLIRAITAKAKDGSGKRK